MPSARITRDQNDQMYFITLTVRRWYYLFDRHNRWDILIDSLRYCQEHKQLLIFGYVLMLNHLHLIVKSPDVSVFLRDFKKYTSYQLMENVRGTEPRVAALFKTEGEGYEIWERRNIPKLIETEKFFRQKKEYLEYNPVRKGYVEEPGHWIYSSVHEPNLLKLATFC